MPGVMRRHACGSITIREGGGGYQTHAKGCHVLPET
jgi:hypothetical protein